VRRPLKGKQPTIDLAIGCRADNPSSVLKIFLDGIDQLISVGPAGSRVRR